MEVSRDREIERLILAVRDRDDVAFSDLVVRYTPLINKLVCDFCARNSAMRFDEAFAEACVGLYRAALSYDLATDKVTFGLYSRICIYRRLCDFVGRDYSDKVSLLDDCDVESLSSSDMFENGILGAETVSISIKRAKEILSDYEYNVFILYLKGYSTSAIAKELSRTPKSVDNTKARMMRRLRENSDSFSDLN